MRAYFVRAGCAAAALFLLVAIVKSTVADVYRVGSGSMCPTLFGGANPETGRVLDERVLVRFGSGEVERFSLVVVRRGADAPIVKRVVGLPGESVGIAGGDLVVGGRRLPLEAPRPAPLPVFDDALQDVEEHFLLRAAPAGPWERAGDAWRLDASAVARGSDAGLMLFQRELRDDYLDEDGRRVVGLREVNDARLECEVRLAARGASEAAGDGEGAAGSPAGAAAGSAPEPTGERLRFRLVEAGDTFEAWIELQAGGGAEASLVRFNSRSLQEEDEPGARIEALARAPVGLPRGAWTAIVFENVDNHLVLDVGGDRVAVAYGVNEPHAGPTPEGATSLGPRVALGGEGVAAEFRRIRVLRDLCYAPLGSHGIAQPIALGPDELFVLGDNSSASLDSRMFGPVRLADVIGRPTRVVWPPRRARALAGPAPR